MKTKLLVVTLLVIVQQVNASLKKEKLNLDPLKEKVEKLNEEISSFYTKQNIEGLMQLYDDEIILMPEYSNTLFQKTKIKEFYKRMFKKTQIGDYKRKIFEITSVKDYVIEIGTFKMDYSNSDTTSSYNGKYLNVWKVISDKRWKLVSEMWGSNTEVERDTFPYDATYNEMNHRELPPLKADLALQKELQKRFEIVRTGVINGDANSREKDYLEDVIYMTYYSPMFVGIDQLKPYLKTHYNYGKDFIDRVDGYKSKIIDLEELIIGYGYYFVSWSNNEFSGSVTGKNVSVWKRDKNGALKVYRQMVNHD